MAIKKYTTINIPTLCQRLVSAMANIIPDGINAITALSIQTSFMLRPCVVAVEKGSRLEFHPAASYRIAFRATSAYFQFKFNLRRDAAQSRK